MRSRRIMMLMASIAAALILLPPPGKAASSEKQEWARDPFSRAASGERLKLTGILFHKDSYKAILNGTMVGVGDRIDLYTVMRIGKESVVLNDGKEDVELKLSK